VNSISGFPPIANKSAEILILGSMPSETSLLKHQYYGHPGNAFWPIMLSLFEHSTSVTKLSYQQRKQLLLQNNIAVWDVLQSCFRQGSLDSAIKMDSIKLNNFLYFFSTYTNIKRVCFNGAKSETVYNKYVLPKLENKFNHIEYIRLPSTSPAYAAMNRQQKMTIWANSVTYNNSNK